MATYEELRCAHVKQLLSLVPASLERIEWPSERIAEWRSVQLRRVLAHAKRRSPWYARRLRALDVEHAGEAALPQIEPMTKADLMAHWDEIVTDRRLSLDACERHLARLSAPAYLLDEFNVVCSSGSSGTRGVFVFDREEFARAHAAYIRWVLRAAATLPSNPQERPAVIATVAGSSPVHIGVALAATFTSDLLKTCQFPVTMPLDEIVTGLNEVQPFVLFGYSTVLRRLAGEAEAGRLQIAPRLVTSAVEPLLPEIRDAIAAAWKVPIINAYGTTEFGPMGIGCTKGEGIHVNDDLIIMEPVDDQGRPAAAGESVARYYATGLCRYSEPLIRYEITDEIALLDESCACGTSFGRIATVQGRSDDVFTYRGGAVVHPYAFRQPLSEASWITEYQVRQTIDGAEIDIVASRDCADVGELERRISANLACLGVAAPNIVIRRVDHIRRAGISSKLRRFVALSVGAAPSKGDVQ